MSDLLSSNAVMIRRARHCWGCRKVFPAKSILLSEAIADEGKVYNSYTCQDCYYEMIAWTNDDWESISSGDVGYWRNGIWYSHLQDQ